MSALPPGAHAGFGRAGRTGTVALSREDRLSTETLHATAIASEDRAVLLCGPSGSGKSDLALRLIDRGFVLVSDDQTIVARVGQGPSAQLQAKAPETIRGKLEVRGIGIVEMPVVDQARIALLVELTSDLQRLPEDEQHRSLLGIKVPVVRIDGRSPSAVAKLLLALDHFGLK